MEAIKVQIEREVVDQEKSFKNMTINKQIAILAGIEAVFPQIFKMRKWSDCIAVVKNELFQDLNIVNFDKYVKDEKGNPCLVEKDRKMAKNLFHSIYTKVSI